MPPSPEKKSKTAQEFYDQGFALYKNGKIEEAVACFESAAEADPTHHPSYAMLADIVAEYGDALEAIGCCVLAINAAPDNVAYKNKFASLVRAFKVEQPNPDLKAMVLDCLKTSGVDCSDLGMLWASLLTADPDFKAFYNAALQKDFESFKRVFKRGEKKETLTAPFFLLGLQRLTVFDPMFEQFLIYLRRFLLEDFLGETKWLEAEAALKLTSALAEYCFRTEYIFSCTDGEKKAVEALKAGDEEQAPLISCYRPLCNNVVKTIESLTPIADDISLKVQGQYEEFPYPRWDVPDPTIKSEAAEGFLRGKKAKILVAGCGTGKEPIELALVFPDSEILAVDLSRTSLSYGMMKAEELGIKNVTFRQADILQLGGIGKTFDFIASSGVLHHMDDPMAGWKVLIGLLAPKGKMRIALYSQIARKSINVARGMIAQKGYASDTDGIRAFRRDIAKVLDKSSVDHIRGFRDYYMTAECRDLLFHVNEHQFTLPQLAESLKILGLAFERFYLPKAVLDAYKKDFKDDPACTKLAHWAKFEERHPRTFEGMYRFWCVRD